MQSFDFRKFLPHILIIVGFVLVAMFFCLPTLTGKVLKQGDIINWQAMSHEAKTWHEKTGENTMWSNSMFGGMPTYLTYVPENKNYIAPVQEKISGIWGKPVYFFLLAMIGFYVLMSVMNVDKWLGAVGSIAYAFTSFNAVCTVAGHDSKVLSVGYMPMVLAGIILLFRGRYWAGAALTALSVGLIVTVGHFQMLFYMLIIAVFAAVGFLIEAIREKRIKRYVYAAVISAVVAIVAAGPGMSLVLSTQEYSKYTMRGGRSELTFNHDKGKGENGGLDKAYAFQWSNSIGETFCLMVPYLYGGSSMEPIEKAPKVAEAYAGNGLDFAPMYWGDQPFLGGPVYFGAIVCFLFVLGMMVIRSGAKWWMLAVSILGIAMSWGRHFPGFNYFLFDYLPLYNKFRTPSMTLVIPQLFFPLVGIWGLMEIIKGELGKDELLKKLKIAVGITAGLCVLLAFGGKIFFSFAGEAEGQRQYPAEFLKLLKEDREGMAMKSALTSAFYILAAGALIWAFITQKIKNQVIMIAGVGLLIAIDLIGISAHYLDATHYEEPGEEQADFPMRPVDQQILQDKDPYYRVLDVTTDVYGDAKPAYYHKIIGGYSPAKLEIYQDLIDVHMNGSKGFNSAVLNMLNTKYLVYPGGPNGQAVAQANPAACGNAWFVNEVKWVKTADEEILSLKAPSIGDTTPVTSAAFNPRQTAVVRENFRHELEGVAPGKDSNAYVKLAQYGLNNISFASHNSRNGVAVFSDIYYPAGWHAYIDGKETPIVRANYVLRALNVPAGDHKIEFRFMPDSVVKGEKLATISSILAWLIILGGFGMAIREKKRITERA